MSSWKKEEVERLASLARIQLTDEEIERLGRQLPEIVGYFSQIQAVAEQMPDSGEAVSLENMREDEPGSGPAQLTIAEIKKLAPAFTDTSRQVIVPPVFKDPDAS